MNVEIVDWTTLADDFRDAVVLGNGASISAAPNFGYAELLSAAREDGLITAELDDVFKYIEVPDFELALTMLWHTYHVNRALGITETETDSAYEQLRHALIHTVTKRHVPYADVHDRLPGFADYLKPFQTVISLNYDLIVYWTMMAGNAGHRNWFKDAFLNDTFCHDWEWLRTPFGDNAGATMVFYPHGNLALATDLDGEERKLKVPFVAAWGNLKMILHDLLEEIVKQWDDASMTPLFVSEGTSDQKLGAINRSTYLRNVFDRALPKLGSSVAVYGWSASTQDRHILQQILKGSNRLAFSVRHDGGAGTAVKRCMELALRVEQARLEMKPKPPQPELHFYWAESDGTWGDAA